MKQSHYLLLSLILLFTWSASCKKNPPSNTGSIVIQTSPASGSNQAPAPGPDFPLTVTITAGMPASGVKIDVTARAEGSVTPFFSTSQNSSNPVNNFVITGAPQGVTSVVDVTVTDLGNVNSKATASYRFARKWDKDFQVGCFTQSIFPCAFCIPFAWNIN